MDANVIDAAVTCDQGLVPLGALSANVGTQRLAGRLDTVPVGVRTCVSVLSGLRSLPSQRLWPELHLAGSIVGSAPASGMAQIVQVNSPDEGHEPDATLALATGTGQGSTGQRPLVLVVDDDPIQRKLLKLLVEMLGYDVEVAADGYDAYERAQRFLPDAIMSDVFMPRLDGFGLCKLVRSDPGTTHIPVVLLSAVRTRAEDHRLAQSVGANALVPATPGFAEATRALASSLG